MNLEGGGKTCFCDRLNRWSTTLSRKIFHSNLSKNFYFRNCQALQWIVTFVDEITVKEQVEDEKSAPVNLAKVQHLTGVGIGAKLDEYQKAIPSCQQTDCSCCIIR